MAAGASSELWTVTQVAVHLGVSEGSASAHLSAWGIEAIPTGRRGLMYSAAEARWVAEQRMANVRRSGRRSERMPASSGSTRLGPVERARAAGFEALEPYTGRTTPWRMRCLKCGAELTRYLSTIVPCDHGDPANLTPRRVTAAEATARILDAGWDPLEPYPGSPMVPWRMRCMECGTEIHRESTPSKIRPCRHSRTDDQRQATQAATDFKKLLTSLGFKPIGEYPGMDEPWWAECRQCKRRWLRKPTDKKPCAHKGAGSRNPPLR
ncbi:hypothetical protein [Streptomyces sp. KHY 26]|uniref:hypothetical protein n=1 Tax=Streptomyces sp. KHY 26 TaxID=3097359 RepID=UPI00376F2031